MTQEKRNRKFASQTSPDEMDEYRESEKDQFDTTSVESIPELSKMATVRILNAKSIDGKYLVLDANTGNAYMVPVDDVKYSVKDQEIDEAVLLKAERPYNFDQEIEKLIIDPQDIRVALWTEGIVSEAQMSVGIKRLLRLLIDRGVFPVKGSK